MSEQNTQITETAISRLIDQFKGSPNLLALIAAYLDRVQALEDAAHPLLGERDIDQATGHRLDGIGQIAQVLRSGLDDNTYRLQLKAELAVLRSQGTAEDILGIAQLLIQMTTPLYELVEYFPKGLYLRAVEQTISTAYAPTVAAKLRRAVGATTDMLFVYSALPDGLTFSLSSQASTSETSSSTGLSDDAQTTGGGLAGAP